MRRLSDYRTGNITLYFKTEDFKFKLSTDIGPKLVKLRRKPIDGDGEKQHFDLAFINLYRTCGGKFPDGTFSPSPGTEFFMAMFGPCVNAFLADTGTMEIKSIMETSHLDVIIESWSRGNASEHSRFCKYHLKFRFSDVRDDVDADEGFF